MRRWERKVVNVLCSYPVSFLWPLWVLPMFVWVVLIRPAVYERDRIFGRDRWSR